MKWNPFAGRQEERAASLSFDDYLAILSGFQFQGVNYSLPAAQQEEIGGTFRTLSASAFKQNGVVFACMLARMQLFSEARFQFRQLVKGRPGDLFGTEALRDLEEPWPGGTTGDLLSRMLQHADLAGNAFVVPARGRRGVAMLRPDWTTIIVGTNDPEGDNWDVDADVAGYVYKPGGPGSGREPVFFMPEEVAHFCPIPDPEARFRGMSWLTPIVREVMADKAATDHKLKFFENGATPNMVVKIPVPDLAEFTQWIDKFKAEHEGAANAYKTLYLGAGADATVVGADLKQLDFKVTQGAGETRIAAAAGVPPVIVGLSEGLQAATYSNYGQARRRFADNTMRPLWRNAAGSLARIVSVPSGSELWYDGRDISALQEDEKDAADIQFVDAQAISALVQQGFDPESVVAAITAKDLNRLSHTGLVSVQLLPPGTQKEPPTTPAPNDPPPKRDRGDVPAPHHQTHLHFDEGFIRIEQEPPVVNIHERAVVVEAAPSPDVNVTVEAAEPSKVEFHEGAIRTEVAAPPPAEVNVTVEAAEIPAAPDVTVNVERGGRRRVEFDDGRTATVTEGDVKVVEFDDGETVRVTEVPE